MVVVEVRAPSKDYRGEADRVLTLRLVLVLPTDVHGEGTFPQLRLQHGDLEAHERRPSTPALRGPRTRLDRFCMEDGGMLLGSASQGPTKRIRGGRPPARDVRAYTNSLCGFRVTLFW